MDYYYYDYGVQRSNPWTFFVMLRASYFVLSTSNATGTPILNQPL